MSRQAQVVTDYSQYPITFGDPSITNMDFMVTSLDVNSNNQNFIFAATYISTSGPTVQKQVYGEILSNGITNWIIEYDLSAASPTPIFFAQNIRYDYSYLTAIAYNVGSFVGLTPQILVIDTTLKKIVQEINVTYHMVIILEIDPTNNNIYAGL